MIEGKKKVIIAPDSLAIKYDLSDETHAFEQTTLSKLKKNRLNVMRTKSGTNDKKDVF